MLHEGTYPPPARRVRVAAIADKPHVASCVTQTALSRRYSAAIVFVIVLYACVYGGEALSVLGGNTGNPRHRVVVVGKMEIGIGIAGFAMGFQLALIFVHRNHRFVIMYLGKVIIDEYGSPADEVPSSISVGGGGPQAAFGAAAAMAALSGESGDPKKQPVTFLGPVGQLDWKQRERDALYDTLSPVVESIHLVEGTGLRTPRIQLWHDGEQRVQWKPLHNSFGPEGAEQLWRNRPSADDVLKVLEVDEKFCSLHVILEVGAQAPGDGDDGMLITDSALLERIEVLGVEPIAFPDHLTGEVSKSDAISCISRLNRISSSLDFVSPDDLLYRAVKVQQSEYWSQCDVAVRNGPQGSILLKRASDEAIKVPAATLLTRDRQPINPTGAGNAYSAAVSACLGLGVPLFEAGCIATAIGAVVCEYEHLPPWNGETLTRIRHAAAEVRTRTREHAAQ